MTTIPIPLDETAFEAALEAAWCCISGDFDTLRPGVTAAIRAYLAQASKGEPVAWIYKHAGGREFSSLDRLSLRDSFWTETPLYAGPVRGEKP